MPLAVGLSNPFPAPLAALPGAPEGRQTLTTDGLPIRRSVRAARVRRVFACLYFGRPTAYMNVRLDAVPSKEADRGRKTAKTF